MSIFGGVALMWLICPTPSVIGDRGGTVVKVLCYKWKGRCFDPRWCHWNFSLL